MKLKFYIVPLFIGCSLSAAAQSKAKVPFSRLIWHENIDKTQKSLDKLDRKEDHRFTIGENEDATEKATTALFAEVDQLQDKIEADSSYDNNNKIKFLRGLNEVLASFETNLYKKNVKPAQLADVVPAFKQAMELENGGESITSVIEANDPEIGEVLLSSFTFSKNKGVTQSREIILGKVLHRNPDLILSTLQKNPGVSFTDSLIKRAAYHNPEELYTYAQANNELGRRIKNHSDPLVQTIAKLSKMNTGRLYFPFLDDLYKGKITQQEVEKNLDNKYSYFRLLVNTQIGYAARFHQGDTPMVMSTLTKMIKKKAVEDFINVINGLHDSPDNIRMKDVEPLNAQELYYLCVMGDPEIYTSSYLKVYDRMFQRLKTPSSDSLLMSVKYDHFKKFIKMAAGYNRLDHFLNNMNKSSAEIVMRSFANGLEKTNNLEDAVDVADSYASISNPQLRKLILEEVQSNYNELSKTDNRRGIAIYDILGSVFSSMDSSSKVDLSAKFGIPPIYNVRLQSLKDTSGRIIIQQFFYGDKDGNQVFNYFKNAYSNPNWKIVNKPEWIEVSSTRGVPITIYSNKPLDEDQDLDAKAQASLNNYLEEKGLNPTVVIHRGHSYFVGYTIKQLAPSAKVVLLGSCGGYHNIHGVLDVSPTAHIIASKQVGSGTINQPMIINLTEDLRQGKDLNWPQIWKDFGKMFSKNALFDDYVPPHKNLGAIFIMAYTRTIGDDRS